MILLQSMFCSPDLCFKIYLIIAAGGNNDNFHYISDYFYLVDHPYSYLSEFDLHQSGKISSSEIAKRLAITTLKVR